jgi:S-adenosylmethionine hydrolase
MPARQDIEPRGHAPLIYAVNDFRNGLSPAELAQSVHKVFAAYDVPLGDRSPIISVPDIRPFNITDGAFQIYTLADNVRGEQSIFVGVVDPGVGGSRRGTVVRTTEGHDFIGPDNGLFSPALAQQEVAEAYQIREDVFSSVAPTFHGRDLFAPIAGELAYGVKPADLEALEPIDPASLVKRDFQEGEAVHLDGYPNVKLGQIGIPTNQEGQKATAVTLTTPRLIMDRGLPRRRLTIPVVETFEDVPIGAWLLLEGSSGRKSSGGAGHAEIAIREGADKNGAGNRLRADVGDVFNLDWKFPTDNGALPRGRRTGIRQ